MKETLSDGVYIYANIHSEDGENKKQLLPFPGTVPARGAIGVVVVQYGHAILLADKDKKDVELYPKKDWGKIQRDENWEYLPRECDAIHDWDSEANTAHLIKMGMKAKLPKGFSIPALAPLVAIYHHIDQVNDALAAIGHQRLSTDTVYWSSTEGNAYSAWYLIACSGSISYFYKYYRYRVRPVSALSLD